MVYVLNSNNKPLMPTSRYSKVRRLLKQKKAIVVNREPFTIKLLYETKEITQSIILGVDSGSKFIGLSAITNSKELFKAEYELRNDISSLLESKSTTRRTRRTRKTRYRKSRFLNRVKSKHKGWLAPSIENKIQSHISIINKIHRFLPISNICVEVAAFDIQKIKNPDIQGKKYQQGDTFGFFNIRQFVFFRDNYTCQNPKCKSHNKDKNIILRTHHIRYKSEGGTDEPSNLITLCTKCQTSENHKKGKFLYDWCMEGKKVKDFKDSTFMGIMRWTFYNRLKLLYPNVSLTYGYLTKSTRIELGLDKTHYNDAFCIAINSNSFNGIDIKRQTKYYLYKKVRCNNRQIHKAKILKGGRRKLNQAAYLVKGFRLFDKVLFENKPYYIFGRRSSGFFDIRNLQGEKVNKGSVSCKKLKLIEKRKSLLVSSIDTKTTVFSYG